MVTQAWYPARCPDGVAAALRALNAGNANAAQQAIALRWILFDCCKIRDELFVPLADRADGRRVTDYLLGRRSVGLQIARAMELQRTPLSPRGAPPPMPTARDAAPVTDVPTSDPGKSQ